MMETTSHENEQLANERQELTSRCEGKFWLKQIKSSNASKNGNSPERIQGS